MKRQHYNIPGKVVFIRGNIFIKNKIQKEILDIGSFFEESGFNKIDKIIDGDFTIEDATETSEDTYYYASGGATAFEVGGGFKSRYHFIDSYDKAIDDIVALSKMNVEEMNKRLLNKLLFASVYSALEAFLQDLCGHYVMKSQKHKERYLKNHENLKSEKILLSEIYAKLPQLDFKIKNAIDNTVYHRLSEEIQSLFEGTFGIIFPDYQYLKNKLEIRHDIVHRNGKSKNLSSSHIQISNKQLYELIEHVDEFVHSLFKEFDNLSR